jgi:WhiB family redox-sensing transcriptional regulator
LTIEWHRVFVRAVEYDEYTAMMAGGDLPQLAAYRPGWMRQAACSGTAKELFFPARGESATEPKAVCVGCPVRSECLEYALALGEKHGIWGGLSERERRRLRAQRRLRQAS